MKIHQAVFRKLRAVPVDDAHNLLLLLRFHTMPKRGKKSIGVYLFLWFEILQWKPNTQLHEVFQPLIFKP